MEDINRDHESIRGALSRLERLLEFEHSREDQAATRMLATITQALADHFRREEASDLYVGLPRRVPALAATLADLKVQHGTITELAIDAQGAAERLESSRRELVLLARRLIEQVRAHERSEVEVIQRAFLAE